MHEEFPSFDDGELSDEDLAILQAFAAKDDWSAAIAAADTFPKEQTEDLLGLFVAEANDDITRIRHALSLLEQDEYIDPRRFITVQRSAHKLHGTAGAVECYRMATVAQYMEIISEKVTEGKIFPLIGINALSMAIPLLEMGLQNIITADQEGDVPLQDLEEELKRLNIDIEQLIAAEQSMPSAPPPSRPSHDISIPFIRIDARRLEQLVSRSEGLAQLRAPLETAQEQVESALQELRAAQARLRQIQSMLPSLLIHDGSTHALEKPMSSSLVARILSRSSSTLRRARSSSHITKTTGSLQWDELDLENYNEKDMLIRSLSEAITDVSIASARLDAAYTTLNMKHQEYMSQVADMRCSALLLRLAPLKSLVSRLQRVVTTSAMARTCQVQFEVEGEDTEVDQNILESLTNPLLQMMRTCTTGTAPEQNQSGEPCRIWLHAHCIGNEVTIEIGFSMAVGGGALESIREPIQRLNGTYALQRNTAGGVTFYLHFPRAQGTAQCLLVRVGRQLLLIPFPQIQRIVDSTQEKFAILYDLRKLLGFPVELEPEMRIRPALILPQAVASHRVVGILVDEVVTEGAPVVKPLPAYLQRPGIAGACIDGKGNVLLMLDLLDLVRSATTQHRDAPIGILSVHEPQIIQPKILVADDSVSLRQSVIQTLRHAEYTVLEARDGMEALEKLLEEDRPPDLFLLDIEMPNLNGYDLLNIMRLYPELANVKIVMLTSRSSKKHVQRAQDLGASAYLVKPCPQDKLLTTIKDLLGV